MQPRTEHDISRGDLGIARAVAKTLSPIATMNDAHDRPTLIRVHTFDYFRISSSQLRTEFGHDANCQLVKRSASNAAVPHFSKL